MNTKTGPGDWMSIGTDIWSLSMDAAAVIGLRIKKFAGGGSGAIREAMLMVGEKVESTAHLQFALVTGELGTNPTAATRNALRYCLDKVRANKHRLSAGG